MFVLLLQLHQLGVDVVRRHAFPLHVQQLFEILDLSLELADNLNILAIELHGLDLHHDMTGPLDELKCVHGLVHVVD